MMEMIKSEVQCTLATDMGHYRHVVSYRANNTNPKAVEIIQLSDMIHELGAEGVLTKATGKLTYDGHNIMADGIVICPCFQGIVADFKAIIKAIENGEDVPSRAFDSHENQATDSQDEKYPRPQSPKPVLGI